MQNNKIKWLLELPWKGDVMPKYYSENGLTKNPNDAKQFDTEEQAKIFKDKYLTKSLPHIEATEHIFIDG